MQMKQSRQRRAYPGARLQANSGLEADTLSRRCFQQLILPGEVSDLVLFQCVFTVLAASICLPVQVGGSCSRHERAGNGGAWKAV